MTASLLKEYVDILTFPFSIISGMITSIIALYKFGVFVVNSNVKRDSVFITAIVDRIIETRNEELKEKIRILESDMKRVAEKRADDIVEIFKQYR